MSLQYYFKWRYVLTLYSKRYPRLRIANFELSIIHSLFSAAVSALSACCSLQLKGTRIELIVLALLSDKVIMSAPFNDYTVFKHHNHIGVHNR